MFCFTMSAGVVYFFLPRYGFNLTKKLCHLFYRSCGAHHKTGSIKIIPITPSRARNKDMRRQLDEWFRDKHF